MGMETVQPFWKANVSVPSEGKDVHNVKLLVSQANKISGAEQIIISFIYNK